LEKRREEWRKLTQEERNAKLKEMRERSMEKRREEFNKLTTEEREAKRKELRERLEKRLGELRAKQTNGTITPKKRGTSNAASNSKSVSNKTRVNGRPLRPRRPSASPGTDFD
jgi:acyl-CoA reductase-like NAD-dependent aldehyde dehydrogenase